ncbi:MAG: hypothetical protein DRP11_05240 [Candidatus Aenigmatarchaeota archaeon]|nr:MAG: hypothetical protein DRP11_05240 [Candidatus Aenigmarchaeota archaeon]
MRIEKICNECEKGSRRDEYLEELLRMCDEGIISCSDLLDGVDYCCNCSSRSELPPYFMIEIINRGGIIE